MPIDLVIDERDGTKPDLGDTNNNSGAARASTADTSHTDGSSTPDVVSRRLFSLFLFFFFFFFFLCLISSSFVVVVVVVVVVVDHPHLHGGVVRVASGSKDIAAAPAVGVLQALLSPRGFLSLSFSLFLSWEERPCRLAAHLHWHIHQGHSFNWVLSKILSRILFRILSGVLSGIPLGILLRILPEDSFEKIL